jgi:predicted ATPase
VDFIPLADSDEAQQIFPLIAQVLGLDDPHGSNLTRRLAFTLGQAERLLILDNFEQLVDGSPVLTELLHLTPSLRLLVTSRAALRIDGETLFEVPALSIPGLENLPGPEALRSFEAVRLFEERARMARRDFVLTAETAPAVTAICARLDGLPLAIELVAARTNQLPPQELLARMGGRFVLHLEGPRGRPARHRSMGSAVQWSYGLLPADEQAAFRRYGVFQGGFASPAAEAVGLEGGPPPDEEGGVYADPLQVTTALVDKGLLHAGQGIAGEARFEMLTVVREFALERLQEAGERERAARRHAAHYRAMVEQIEPSLRGPDQQIWLDRLSSELPNLRAAMKWSLAEDIDCGLTIAGGLWRFWLVRSDISEGRDWLGRLLLATSGSGGAATVAGAKARYAAAHLAATQGDIDHARRLAEESLAASHLLMDRETTAFALAVAGDVANKGNEFEQGKRMLSDSLGTFQELGDDSGAAFSLASLGYLHIVRDQLPQARAALDEALRLARRAGDTWQISQILSHVGNLARIDCRYADARALFGEQLQLARDLGSKSAAALALNGLGWVARDEGDFQQAKEAYQEGLALAYETGNKVRMAGMLYGMGVIAWREGDLPKARALLEESLALRLEVGNLQWIVWARYALGDVARSEGDWAAARQAYREALELVRQTGLKSEAAHMLERLGAVAVTQGRPELAAQILGGADILREEVDCTLPPLDQADHDRDVAVVRGKLGPAAFDKAWSAGRAMTLQEAVELGLTV